MHRPLTSFSPPAEVVYRGVPLLSLTAFLKPEVRVECWVRTSVPPIPRDAAVGFTKVLPLPRYPVHPVLQTETEVSDQTSCLTQSEYKEIRPTRPSADPISTGAWRGNNSNNDDNDHIARRNLRFLQSPHCATNCLQHIHSSGQGAVVCKSYANHVQCIERLSYATCHVPHGAKGQLSYRV